MAENSSGPLSRRQWLGVVSTPALAATVGAGILTGRLGAAEAPTADVSPNLAGARVYNIRDFGAKGDGVALDTVALQTAIDACTKDGGGTVLVPAGVFHIGTVELKSNVTLHVAASGKLLGSGDGKQYRPAEAIPLRGDTTLNDGNWALLFAVGAKNVTIEGPGVIDGQGAQFHPAVRGETPPSGLGGNRRPYHLLFYRCENLVVRDLNLIACAYHSVRVIQSAHIRMHGLYIFNRVNGNNDGFHFVSCEHVAISNCTVYCQDDACALFGSCKFVTVTNSVFSTRWSVFRFGGGTTENITVSNCVLSHVYGCPIKFQGDPGSHFENISFSDLVLEDVTGPISISISSPADMGPPAPRIAEPAQPAQPVRRPGPVTARNISFSNIHGTVTTEPSQLADTPFPSNYNPGEKLSCIVLNCLGSAVLEHISFSNVHLTFGGGGTADVAANRNVPEVAGEYFRLGPMPAFGLYARNVRGLTLDNVRFQTRTPELRPAVIFDRVEDAAIRNFSVEGNPAAESVLRFINSKNALLTAPRVLTPAPTFLRLEGAANDGIVIQGGDLAKAAAPVAFHDGATEKAARISL